tara:strand:+ start:483 stop:674 length:192 start_codon:yes stop_codon:yes gene_type:complete
MCFAAKKTKTADEFYKEMKKDYGPLPSLSMGDPVQKNQMMKDVPLPQMRTSGMETRSLIKVNY